MFQGILLSILELTLFLSFIKPNIFADTFKGLTFYIESKNENKIKNIL